MVKQYQVGIVRGLENLQDVIRVISDREDRLLGYKYHSRPGIVSFSANGGTNIASVLERLQKMGLSAVEVLR